MTKFTRKRQAVSVVISAMLIMGITAAGALFVSNLIQTSSITSITQTPKSTLTANSVKLTAFDTRDGLTLSAIPTLNNKFDNELCTDRCNANPDNIPTSVSGEGTEFIVLQIRNRNVNPITIKNIQINGITHTWASETAGYDFDASSDDGPNPTKYPGDGKFSILPYSNVVTLTQRSSPTLSGDQEARLVIKLSENIFPDIGLGKSILVLVNFGDIQPARYVIVTGDTK